jgi:hypothetical protein
MRTIKLSKKDMYNIHIALKHFLMSTPLFQDDYSLSEDKESYSKTLEKIEYSLRG